MPTINNNINILILVTRSRKQATNIVSAHTGTYIVRPPGTAAHHSKHTCSVLCVAYVVK